MFTYIKKNIIGNYLESDIALETASGYEDAVGKDWKDYLAGKFLLLSQEQLAFRNEHPELPVENVWYMVVPKPPVVEPEPERTLEDAKNEMIANTEAYYDSPEVNAINVNGLSMYFNEDECNNIKLRLDGCTYRAVENFRLRYEDMSFIVPIQDGYNVINNMAYHRYENINAKNDRIVEINKIESIENVDKFDFVTNAPVTPSVPVTIIPEPQDDPKPVVHYVTYKTMDCSIDNEVYEIADGDSFAVTVTPNEGFAIKRDDFVAMMGDENLSVQFYDDNWGRVEYASAVFVSIKSVTADVVIATLGYPYDEKSEPEPQVIDEPEQPTADTYYITYKLDNTFVDNDIAEVSAYGGWKSCIYPEKGCAIAILDIVAEMGGKPLDIEFGPDELGRKEYASYAMFRVDSVTGDIFIACPAHYLPEK